MKRKLLTLRSCISQSSCKKNKTRQDWSSPVLDNAGPSISHYQTLEAEESMFWVFKQQVWEPFKSLVSLRLGSFTLNNVPWINVLQKTKGNKTNSKDLVSHIIELLDSIGKALENQKAMNGH
jgi:uncharacterized phage-associated protein